MFSVAGYRINPMARAIIDTYTSFCVGDSGLTLQCPVPEVRAVAEEFWRDSANGFADQELMLRGALIMGERVDEMMTGPTTGIVRRSVIDPTRIENVVLRSGNPLWPAALMVRHQGGAPKEMPVVAVDDFTGLRAGQVLFGRWWRTTELDQRGYPFLGPVLDWLDSYDNVLANLIDRTALGRYLVWDVTVNGNQTQVDDFVASRGGRHTPLSGTVEVHNENVTWEPKTAQIGAQEDTTTAAATLTNVAAGAGLAKTWLADPEDANRATSLTMGEPVRRRIGGVQNLWLAYVTEMVRYRIDQAVAVRRLEAEYTLADGKQTRAADTLTITGPEIADSPANVGAEVLVNLAKSITVLRRFGVLSEQACRLAARKGWEDFMGVPYRPELDGPDADPDDIADELDRQRPTPSVLDALLGAA